MGNIKKGWLIGGIIAAILFGYFGLTFNSIVKKEEAVNKNWANLQATYQRRFDLIPKLVSVVKGSSDYEKQVLTQLTEARAKAGQTIT